MPASAPPTCGARAIGAARVLYGRAQRSHGAPARAAAQQHWHVQRGPHDADEQESLLLLGTGERRAAGELDQQPQSDGACPQATPRGHLRSRDEFGKGDRRSDGANEDERDDNTELSL